VWDFLADGVAMGQGLLRVLRFFPVGIIPPLHFTRNGETSRVRVLKLSINFEEFPAGAHRNFEKKMRSLFSIMIIIIILNA